MKTTTRIKQQFLKALKRGTGEAYLILKNNPEINFSDQIIKGALNIYAYDGQSEGDRAQYIFDIISISKQKDKIRKAVLLGLATEQNDTWNLTHLFALTKLYAQQNDSEAKQAIYDRFLNHPIEGSDWVGESEIVELDGLDGLFYVSEKYGRYIEQNPGDWQDGSVIRHFQEEHKDINVYAELNERARFNKYIQIYLDNVERTKASWEKHKKELVHYKDIVEEVLTSKPFISVRRKRNLTGNEVNQIAERLIEETDKSAIERLLDIFNSYRFPYDSNIILNFAKQKRTHKNSMVDNAISALKYLKSQSIREFALDKVQTTKKPIDFLEILISNYKSGDAKLLSEIANKTNSEYKIEQLAGIYTDIYKANQTKECKEPLEILYSKMNCAIHRNGIVKILIENGVLSDKIREEIKYDCDSDTRTLSEKK
ncbi:hypothetical protein [Xanthocytophaga flava]|uniref:hypothetical protein n=1 Tax=Xanthocytophaga flava TaxID=3048013 RepID=UPI0028D8350B|nr:hypothetical protein [Xanthocytophaga flavus]MDJ1471153.1 hypothetical protein [Xanthocytophaga flavus]